jgi:hypothetical protein
LDSESKQMALRAAADNMLGWRNPRKFTTCW